MRCKCAYTRLGLVLRLIPLLLLLVLIVLVCLATYLHPARAVPSSDTASNSIGAVMPLAPSLSSSQRPLLAMPGTSQEHLLSAAITNQAEQRASATAASDCIVTKALDDPSQPNACIWENRSVNGWYNIPGTLTLYCQPASDTTWLAQNPQVYNCDAYSDGGTFYCNVPTNVVLREATIRCSQTEGGTLLICNYNYLSIGDCSPSCKNVTITTSTLTGVPTAVPAQNGTPVVCPVTVPTCSAPTAGAPAANDWLLGSGSGLLVTTSGTDTYGNALVQKFEGFSFTLALSLLAIPFVFGGLQLMRGGLSGPNRADVAGMFSRILVAVGAVVMSFYLIQLFIDLESALVNGVFTGIQAPPVAVFMPSANWGACTQQLFGSIFNLSVYNDQQITGVLTTNLYLQDTYTVTMTLITNMGYYVLTLLSVLLAVQMVTRLALLNAYIIVSPLTIVCSALPGERASGIMWSWLRDFTALLFVQLLQLLIVWVCIQFVPTDWLTTGTGDWVKELLAKLVPIVVLGMTLSVPRLLNSPATRMMATISSSIGGAMTGIILIIRGGF